MTEELSIEKRAPTTIEIIQQVLASGGKAAEMAVVVKELVALKQSEERFQWEREERQAKIDFDEALNRCQKAVGMIQPNQGRKSQRNIEKPDIFWLDYVGLDKVLRPIYTEEGFSISFSEIEDSKPGYVGMKATLCRSGISREYFKYLTTEAAFDKMPKADAEASAASRVKRYLMLQIFNIAVGIDKDEKAPYDVTNGELADWIASIEGAASKAEAWKLWEAALVKVAPSGNEGAASALTSARTRTIEKLKGEGHA